MNYSMCLMALVTSRVEELKTQLHETLEPHLEQIIERVISFFGQ